MRTIMLIYIVGVTLFTCITGTEIVSPTHLQYLSIYCWYLIEFSAIYELFYCILKTLNAIDSSWLADTKGHIGAPNAISTFYSAAIGFFLTTYNHFVNPIDAFPATPTYIAAALIVLRDVLIILWHFIFGKNYKQGISAGYADKIRTIILSAWLVSTTLAITIPETSLGIAMIWISWSTLLLAGIISPIGFIIDIYRITKIKKKSRKEVEEFAKNFHPK